MRGWGSKRRMWRLRQEEEGEKTAREDEEETEIEEGKKEEVGNGKGEGNDVWRSWRRVRKGLRSMSRWR